MSNAQRYNPRYLRDCDGDWFTTGNEESENGRYVLHSDYADLFARHAALVEAAAWERECRDMKLKMYRVKKAKSFHNAVHSLYALRDAARAEVDKLLQENT